MFGYLKEFWSYKHLVWTFVARDIRARYKQTSVGIAWAIVQPLFMTILFTVIFSKFLKVSTNGVPYPVFSFIALAAWTFFSRTITVSSSNLLGNYSLISKIYFPREVIPFSTVVSSLIDFFVASLISIILLIIYQIPVTWHVIYLPIIFFVQIAIGFAFSLLFSGSTIIFRDLQFVYPFLAQLLMYATPVIYSVRNLQSKYKFLFFLNPLTGIIEGYRSVLLYNEIPNFYYLLISIVFSLIVLIFSYWLFKRIEKYMADIL